MKRFKLEIETVNDAFQGCENAEIARILKKLAAELDANPDGDVDERILWDFNGNKVGVVSVRK